MCVCVRVCRNESGNTVNTTAMYACICTQGTHASSLVAVFQICFPFAVYVFVTAFQHTLMHKRVCLHVSAADPVCTV